jgi:hypothetical protein
MATTHEWARLLDGMSRPVPGLPKGILRCRYVEYADQGAYSVWGDDKVETRYMNTDQIPDWLERILAVAKVGGHIVWVSSPPPTMSLWFDMTPQRELIEFVNLRKPDVS